MAPKSKSRTGKRRRSKSDVNLASDRVLAARERAQLFQAHNEPLQPVEPKLWAELAGKAKAGEALRHQPPDSATFTELGRRVRQLGMESETLKRRIEAGLVEPESDAAPADPPFHRLTVDPFWVPAWRRPEVFNSIRVIIAAFEEVEGYDPKRHHNQPPPALWLNDRAYLTDVKALLTELEQLNKVLRELADREKDPPKPVARKVDAALTVLGAGGKKFIESYCDMMGKGAAVLTIGAFATFLASAGLPKELVDAIWAHIKPGR